MSSSNNTLTQEELDYILSHNTVGSLELNKFSEEQLVLDYTNTIALEMNKLFQNQFEKFKPCLHLPGIGTRFRQFHEFLSQFKDQDLQQLSNLDAFVRFANYLGRVTSYRALALTSEQYDTLVKQDSIYPTGRLKTDKATVESMVSTHGVWKICHARLYIGMRMVRYDPSLSLHDNPETATCIASGYSDDDRKVHLMELDVPLIEVLGYSVSEVSFDPTRRWFEFEQIWFDAFDHATERYTLFEIPFLSKRLKHLRIFDNDDEIAEFLEPFRQIQREKKLLSGL